MLSEKMTKALNEQVAFELYSGYIYWSMAAWCSENGLNGSANWMMMQAGEELFHAHKMNAYVIERGGRAKMLKIDEPRFEWGSLLEVFQNALEHERSVTSRINNLVDLAMAERDHASTTFLQWYVTEQVEEEAGVEEIISQLKLIGNDGRGLLMIDRELAARTFTWPAPAADAT